MEQSPDWSRWRNDGCEELVNARILTGLLIRRDPVESRFATQVSGFRINFAVIKLLLSFRSRRGEGFRSNARPTTLPPPAAAPTRR